MQLETGKYYRTAEGDVEKIMGYSGDSEFPHMGSSGNTYRNEGGFSQHGYDPGDLICEITITDLPQPEPAYRPFTMKEAETRLLGEKVRLKGDGTLVVVGRINSTGVSPDWWFKVAEFLDGTPCGALE